MIYKTLLSFFHILLRVWNFEIKFYSFRQAKGKIKLNNIKLVLDDQFDKPIDKYTLKYLNYHTR
jgi:hypothetical protein